ncbi:hypothetical protein BDV41DRAFT_307778 [Aspergillus transmontanensis]|uniref:Uncharacterized protein n=1 Tax=Aspergillus transmontanensis TaxID=1034304 RepID=A0A5N6VV59_9EURO|nr:hypothetical protein BDV41DRAFT_307778 [Aspergillus transmontanensis]
MGRNSDPKGWNSTRPSYPTLARTIALTANKRASPTPSWTTLSKSELKFWSVLNSPVSLLVFSDLVFGVKGFAAAAARCFCNVRSLSRDVKRCTIVTEQRFRRSVETVGSCVETTRCLWSPTTETSVSKCTSLGGRIHVLTSISHGLHITRTDIVPYFMSLIKGNDSANALFLFKKDS